MYECVGVGPLSLLVHYPCLILRIFFELLIWDFTRTFNNFLFMYLKTRDKYRKLSHKQAKTFQLYYYLLYDNYYSRISITNFLKKNLGIIHNRYTTSTTTSVLRVSTLYVPQCVITCKSLKRCKPY